MPVKRERAERSTIIGFSLEDILGFLGGALITFALVPQVWRLYSLKSAREISLPFSVMLLLGGMFWLSYGVFLGLLPVIIWNALSILLVSAMIYAKSKYGG